MNTVGTTGRLWRGTARGSRDEYRRRRLLDAALELYGTVGFRKTAVQQLCTVAHVSTRSFYELYQDQDDLLTSLYRELNKEILEGLTGAAIDSSASFAMAVRGLIEAALTPTLSDERKVRVLEVESVGVSDRLEQERRLAYRTFAEAIDAIFAIFEETKRIASRPPTLASLILVGGITEALVQRVQVDWAERSSAAEFLDEVAEVIIRLASPRGEDRELWSRERD